AIDELDLRGLRVVVARDNGISPTEDAVWDAVSAAAGALVDGLGLQTSDAPFQLPPDLLDLGGALFQADVDPQMADAFVEIMTNLFNTEGAAPLLAGAFDPAL